jgi:acetyl esterase/lipase
MLGRLMLVLTLLFPVAVNAQPKKEPPRAPKLPAGTSVDRDVPYGKHERQKLDVFVPPGDGPFPLVLWVHGGGWEGGSKAGGPAMGLLREGYAVASTNYRLSQHAPFPAQIEDVKAAVRFLRANAKKYRLDPDRFGAAGGSAGGHLVALLGTAGDVSDLEGSGGHKDVSSRVACVLDFFGPSDLEKLAAVKPGDSPITRLLGGPVKEKKELADKANPIRYASKDDPPFLIVHGDKDEVVPLSQSELLHNALKKAGVDSTLITVRGGGHGAGIFVPELTKDYVAFFDRHLKKK